MFEIARHGARAPLYKTEANIPILDGFKVGVE